MMDADTLLFFDGRPEELSLYEAILGRIRVLGDVTPVVHKTQISLRNRRVFACVSMLRVRKKALLPPHYLVLTLGLPYPIRSSRIDGPVEARPGRWTHHIVVSEENELDEELLGWVRKAYAFADR